MMRPEDFVSRMIDVFALDLGSFGVLKPKTLTDAHHFIVIAAHGCTDIEKNGYRWRIWSQSVLDHVVIKASVSDGVSEIIGSVCFNHHCSDQIIASWHPSRIDSPESQMNMLAMLTLKTNNKLKVAA